MAHKHPPGPPMTLGNMRAMGASGLQPAARRSLTALAAQPGQSSPDALTGFLVELRRVDLALHQLAELIA
jgi:hypothetical protein